MCLAPQLSLALVFSCFRPLVPSALALCGFPPPFSFFPFCPPPRAVCAVPCAACCCRVLCRVLCCGCPPCVAVGCCAFCGVLSGGFLCVVLCCAVLLVAAVCCAASLTLLSRWVARVVACCLVLINVAACCVVSLVAAVCMMSLLCCAVQLCAGLFSLASFGPAACSVEPSCTVLRPGVLCLPALRLVVLVCALCSPQCVFCRGVLVRAVAGRCSLCCVCPGMSGRASPVLSALRCAALCWSGALAWCCSFGLCCFWRLVPWRVDVCCHASFGVLRCAVTLRCWVRGVLCCCALCRVLLRPVVLCRGASLAQLCCAVLALLRSCPCVLRCCFCCAWWCPVVLPAVSVCLPPGRPAGCCVLVARCGVGVHGWSGWCPVVGCTLSWCPAPLRCAYVWSCAVVPCGLFPCAVCVCLLWPPSKTAAKHGFKRVCLFFFLSFCKKK